MSSPENGPTPPEGVPDKVATELPQLTPDELRNTIIYAQELLRFHDETDSPVEPGPNEEILRATKRDGYTEVVKRTTCAEECADCPHGPYLYHVKEETRPEGGTKVRWMFLGEVYPDEE
ncbi:MULTISPECIES: hypothetical protein [Haloarcula]|uniref:Uncharacterized protein n=3 Tax=Haloarcula TaxID=2237 RepID=A0ACC6VR63_9EURY|nr:MULTISPECIES: hypothetical protein [Haloarcula]NLV12395.1 hypothetical protein [Haloarcula argentinensis]GGK64826.1 hypothetical protein GCM10009067_16670 [Haloarcula sebkhae]